MAKYLDSGERAAVLEVVNPSGELFEVDWSEDEKRALSRERAGSGPEEAEERTSIFEKMEAAKDMFRQEVLEATGHYSVDVIRAAKRVIFGHSKMDSCSIDDMVKVLRYVVENVCQMSPEAYFSNWSSKVNRKLGIEGIIIQIANAVPDSVKRECCFDQKRIVFATAYPEVYESKFEPITCTSIWHAKGDVKAGLIRNAKIDTAAAGLEGEDAEPKRPGAAPHGGMVDKIVYDAMTEVFRSCGYNIEAALAWCSNWQRNIAGASKEPGFISVIKARGCYSHPLDFYFLNSPPAAQLEYFDYYSELRRAAGIPENLVLSSMEAILADPGDARLIRTAVSNETDQEYFDDEFFAPADDRPLVPSDFGELCEEERGDEAM